MTQGRIELIIGPMYAGKSSKIIEIANRYKIINKKILSINHKINNRYGTHNISTHNKNILGECISTDTLVPIKYIDLYKSADIIIIEELQFFHDALQFVVDASDNDSKIVICAGLSGDFNRKSFGDVLKLIPYADKITKLSALCKFCNDGTKAHFTKLIKGSEEQIQVGSVNKYEAVCRKHYLSEKL